MAEKKKWNEVAILWKRTDKETGEVLPGEYSLQIKSDLKAGTYALGKNPAADLAGQLQRGIIDEARHEELTEKYASHDVMSKIAVKFIQSDD